MNIDEQIEFVEDIMAWYGQFTVEGHVMIDQINAYRAMLKTLKETRDGKASEGDNNE